MLLHDILIKASVAAPDSVALTHNDADVSYRSLANFAGLIASGLTEAGAVPDDRVAVYLPKCAEEVAAYFGASQACCVLVPVNPVLKAAQVAHILNDCAARFLVTTADRFEALKNVLESVESLSCVIVTGGGQPLYEDAARYRLSSWEAFISRSRSEHSGRAVADSDMAAIFYTSGSTGMPKGVVVSHANLLTGCKSVAQYLANSSKDRILSVLPFAFDYGFSQLTTAFHAGARIVLLDYLFPADVIQAVSRHGITGIAAVPSLWIRLAQIPWPDAAAKSLRYITNSGGALPVSVIEQLRQSLPDTQIFLMYGLTEAFRSTYLPPEELDRRPNSIGKAVPDAEVMVINESGEECAADEPGELVHKGPFVSLGYWGRPEETRRRFRPAPHQGEDVITPEIAVWSGDKVVRDEEGFLYFLGRQDEMIKTSGYRVSPEEVEAYIYSTGLVAEVVALGAPHPLLGEAIVVVAVSKQDDSREEVALELLAGCREHLPAYMVPLHMEWREALARNPNGKTDRTQLKADFKDYFQE